MTRRLFLELGKRLGTVALAAASLPALFFWWRAAARPTGSEDPWIDLGLAREIPEGEWSLQSFSVERRNRWRHEITQETLYLRRLGRDLTVLSSICPHARCLVRQEGEGFACRCHSSFFDADGQPLGGPASRRLDEFEWRVEKGHLLVRYQKFRPGIDRQEALSS